MAGHGEDLAVHGLERLRVLVETQDDAVLRVDQEEVVAVLNEDPVVHLRGKFGEDLPPRPRVVQFEGLGQRLVGVVAAYWRRLK